MKVLSDLPVLCGNSPLPLSGCGSMSVGPFLASPSHASALPCPVYPLELLPPAQALDMPAAAPAGCLFHQHHYLSLGQQGQQAASPRAWLLLILALQTCPWHSTSIQALASSHSEVCAAHIPTVTSLTDLDACCPSTPFPPPSVSQQPLEGQRASAPSLKCPDLSWEGEP